MLWYYSKNKCTYLPKYVDNKYLPMVLFIIMEVNITMSDKILFEIETYNTLTQPKRILVSLLQSRHCTIEQIYNALLYKSYHAAGNTLVRLKNAGFLTNDIASKFNNMGAVYYLTNKGAEAALMSMNIDPYSVDKNGKLIAIYNKLSDTKISTSYLGHYISVTDFYYTLLRRSGYNRYTWYNEGDMSLTSKDQKTTVRGDGGFDIDNHQYIIEQDMGTMTKSAVQRKLTNYSQVLYDNKFYPTILFSINLEYSLSSKDKMMLFAPTKKLKGDVEMLKTQMSINCNKYNELNENELNMELSKVKDTLNNFPDMTKSIRDYFKKREMALMKLLDNNSPSLDVQKYKIAYENKKEQFTKQKKEIIYNALIGKYNIRIGNIKNLLLQINDIKDNRDSIYHRLLEGLDIYINTHQKLIEYTNLYIGGYINSLNIASEAYYNNLISQFQDDSELTFDVLNKYQIINGHESFIIDKLIRMTDGSTYTYFMFYDISYGNMGSYVRLKHQIMNFNIHEDNIIEVFIVTIVDSSQQAKDIRQDALSRFTDKHIQYINISTILTMTQNKQYTLSELKVFNFDDNTLNYLYT